MVLILSWNVAGLSTTVNRIHDNYQPPVSSSSSPLASPIASNLLPSSSSSSSSQQQQQQQQHYKNNRKNVANGRNNNNIQQQHPSASVAHYFSNLHHADIICLQEHKISKRVLCNRSEPRHCSTLQLKNSNSISNDDGITYESFWSCCVDDNFKGLNGVVTYAKKGTVVSANGTTVLGSPELDNQGRCIMTDHGAFVLFNVYVPNTCGQSLTYKMKFLNALRRSMQRERQRRQQHTTTTNYTNKPVILVGDLNIAHTIYDVHWKNRVVYIDEIRNEVKQYYHQRKQQQQQQQQKQNQQQLTQKQQHMMEENEDTALLPPWKIDIANHWDYIESVLQTKHVIPTQTTNSKTNEKYSKYRLAVSVPTTSSTSSPSSKSSTPIPSSPNTNSDDNNNNNKNNKSLSTKLIYLGSHEIDPSYCLYEYDFEEYTYYDEDSQRNIVARQKNTVPVGILMELMYKIANVSSWSSESKQLQRDISKASTVDEASPTRKWLTSLIEEDNMIDTFRYYYPTAEGRFTCWNQNKNQRYVNCGAKIDYTLIDRALLPYLQPGKISTMASASTSSSSSSSTTTTTTTTKREDQHESSKRFFLRCGCNQHTKVETELVATETVKGPLAKIASPLSPLSEAAALCAATASGKFHPAAFEGGGITEATQVALDTQFGLPHTGLVYTPPSFSDHIGISMLLSDDVLPNTELILDTNDTATRKAQPHKLQQSIASFCTSSVTSCSKTEDQASANKNTLKSTMLTSNASKNGKHVVNSNINSNKKRKEPSRGSILHHFKRQDA